jgi:molecular chaperone Hsp33
MSAQRSDSARPEPPDEPSGGDVGNGVGDSVVRAMTDDGAFRVLCARVTDTARRAAQVQSVRGEVARRMAELIAGAALIREAMAPDQRVQAILSRADGRGVVADSHPDGACRGIVTASKGASGAAPRLQVLRTLDAGNLQQGVVRVPDTDSISEALMAYMQASEQIVTVIAVAAIGPADGDDSADDSAIGAAGGYLVQMLPEADHDALDAMTRRLTEFAAAAPLSQILADDDAPRAILAAVMSDIGHAIKGVAPLRFGCQCSRERMLAGVASLPPADLREMFDDGHNLEVACDGCGAAYTISLGDLGEMLAPPRSPDGAPN